MDFPAFQIVAMALISFALELIPPLKRWWDSVFNSAQKQFVIALVVLLLAVGQMAYGCAFNQTCPADYAKAGVDLVIAVLAGLLTSAGAYKSTNYIGEELAYGRGAE